MGSTVTHYLILDLRNLMKPSEADIYKKGHIKAIVKILKNVVWAAAQKTRTLENSTCSLSEVACLETL